MSNTVSLRIILWSCRVSNYITNMYKKGGVCGNNALLCTPLCGHQGLRGPTQHVWLVFIDSDCMFRCV